MSWTLSDQEFSAYSPPRVLRARPLGIVLASMIGVAPICLVALTPASNGKSTLGETKKAPLVAMPAAPAPEKIATKLAAAPSAETSPTQVSGPSAAFDLSVPELAKEKKTYSVLADEQGAGRRDVLTFGDFDDGGAYLRLEVQQIAGEKPNSDFFLDMTRHATQAGLTVERIGRPAPLASRFGAFEAAEIRLSHLAGEGAAPAVDGRSCLAVRLMNAKLSLEIAGVGCGIASKPIDRRAMSCILDHLEYSSTGENTPLQEFFSRAELERGKSCANVAAPSAPAKAQQQQGKRLQPKKRAASAAR